VVGDLPDRGCLEHRCALLKGDLAAQRRDQRKASLLVCPRAVSLDLSYKERLQLATPLQEQTVLDPLASTHLVCQQPRILNRVGEAVRGLGLDDPLPDAQWGDDPQTPQARARVALLEH
jgi:hypothetical protein